MALSLLMLVGAGALTSVFQKDEISVIRQGPIPFAYNTCPNYPTDYSNEHSRPAFRPNEAGSRMAPTTQFFETHGHDSLAGIEHDPNDPSTCPWPAYPGPGRSPLTSNWSGSMDFHRDHMDPQYYYMNENIPQRTGDLRAAEMNNMALQREAEAPRKFIGRVMGESVRDPIEAYDRTLYGRKLDYRQTVDYPGHSYEITHNKEIDIEEGTRAAPHNPTTYGPRPDHVSMQDESLQLMENPILHKSTVSGQHGFIHPLDSMPGQPSKQGTMELDPSLYARGHSQFSGEKVWHPEHDLTHTPWEDSTQPTAYQAPGHRATAAALVDRADFNHETFPHIREISLDPQTGHSKPTYHGWEPANDIPYTEREKEDHGGPRKTRQPNQLETSRDYVQETGIRTLEVQNTGAMPYEILSQRDANSLAYLDPDSYAFDHRDAMTGIEEKVNTGI